MSNWIWEVVFAVSVFIAAAFFLRFRHLVLGSSWFDFIVPWARSFNQVEAEKEKNRKDEELAAAKDRIKHANKEALIDLQAGLISLREVEAERQRSVDTRLSTIVGLASIAGTIAMGIIVAQAAGTLTLSNIYGRWALGIFALYVVLQLCDAIYWAVRGQSRHTYKIDTVEDLLPQPNASEEEQLRRRITAWVTQLQVNQSSVSQKVTAMAVAHQAAKNFAVGLLALSIVGLTMMTSDPVDPPALSALRADANLRALLQGPAGPKGEIGPTGLTGATGPKGEAGPPGPSATSKPNRSAANPRP